MVAALSNLIEGKVAWWENDGAQTFSEHVLNGSYAGAKSVFAADINKDNHIDILSTASTQNDLRWWQNDGAGNFTAHSLDSNFLGVQGVYAADVDGDLDVDIVAASYEGDMIALWENDGNALFTKRIIASNFYGAQAVHIADIDGNGVPDILGVSSILNTVAAWLDNPSNRGYVHRSPVPRDNGTRFKTILKVCRGDHEPKEVYHNGVLVTIVAKGC